MLYLPIIGPVAVMLYNVFINDLDIYLIKYEIKENLLKKVDFFYIII